MPCFYGEHNLHFDDKGRLMLPAVVRRNLDPELDGAALYAVTGRSNKLWLYPDRYYEALVAQHAPQVEPTDESLSFELLSFALAWRIEVDAKGRILIPEKLMHRFDLQREATLLGVRDHLEIWNREEWELAREAICNQVDNLRK